MHQVNVGEDMREHNRRIAAENREMLRSHGVVSLNIMSAPGAGKTSLLVRTLPHIGETARVAVIEGDLQTSRDAERIAETGVAVHQITTGEVCHLDAAMVHSALHRIDLDLLDLILVENVGNLVCPAEFDLGVDGRVMLLSVTEGDDKPRKYPLMFMQSRLLVLNKIDLLPHVDFDVARASGEARELNPDIEIIELSCRTGEGFENWLWWLDRFRKTNGGA
ncbi:MAG: hydrogenase nickel incorporation protein HypB [Candidatus Krumholzibacteriota bacterium]|nr:hydrogenase nickel incorporation protein HypB [Candidatus Krumholzibacteriota bacterium]